MEKLSARERRWIIIEMLSKQREVTTSEILNFLKSYGIQANTVSNDLSLMQSMGIISKIRHGVYSLPKIRIEELFQKPYTERLLHHIMEKKAIAKYVVSILPRDGIIAIDAGTTTTAIFEEIISEKYFTLEIITNNLHGLIATFSAENLESRLIGGKSDSRYAVVVGEPPMVGDPPKKMRVSNSIVGVSGVSKDSGISTFDDKQWNLKIWMSESCSRLIIPATHSKIGKIHGGIFFNLKEAQDFLVITDNNKDGMEKGDIEDFEKTAEQLGNKLIVVNQNGIPVSPWQLVSWSEANSIVID